MLVKTTSKGVVAILRTTPATVPASIVDSSLFSWNISNLFKLSFATAKEVNCEVPMKALGREVVAPRKKPLSCKQERKL